IKIMNMFYYLDYENLAIEIFQVEYNFLRCAQCHIILGIIYRRLRMYDKAIKNYNLAKHLGGLEKNNQIIQLAKVNLGYLHSSKGDLRSAIHYYLELKENPKVNLKRRLRWIRTLTKENNA